MKRKPAQAAPARRADPFEVAQRHHAEGRLAQAEAGYRAVLAVDPRHERALFNLGAVLGRLGRPAEAVDCFAQVLALAPGDFAAVYNLGFMLQQAGRMAEAADAYAKAVAIQPPVPQAYNNLGLVLLELGRVEEARAVFLEATDLAPREALIWFNRGNAERESGRYALAVAAYDTALRLQPGFVPALNNRGLALLKLGRAREALAAFDGALAGDARHVSARTNRGVALYDLGQVDAAITAHREALARAPTDPEVNVNLGVTLLAQGLWAEAAPHYRYRWELPANRRFARDHPPLWDGTPMAGTLLVATEQGLGDVLQFVRFCAAVRPRVGRVVLAVPPRLVRLLRGVPGVDEVVAETQPIDAERRIPLLDLPFLVGPSAEGVTPPPYLAAEPDLVADWAARLGGGRKIGVAWQGSVVDGRSIPLAQFEALRRPDVRFIALVDAQPRDGDPPVERLDLDRSDGFVDTAAVMMSLDLVVTCDTSIAHLAGSLGVPTWVGLKAQPDWRWCAERDRSPWYPSLRLYRQERPGDWAPPLARMAADLDEVLR